MSAFLKVVLDAKLTTATHEQRTRERVQAWFATHPECHYRVEHVTDAGVIRRSNLTINIQGQYRPFDETRMKINPHVTMAMRQIAGKQKQDYFSQFYK